MPRTISSVLPVSITLADVVITALDRAHNIFEGDVVSLSLMGSRSIWYCFTKPPTLATSATPGTELSWYLMNQS